MNPKNEELELVADIGSEYTKLLLGKKSEQETFVIAADKLNMRTLPLPHPDPKNFAKRLSQSISYWLQEHCVEIDTPVKVKLALSPPYLYDTIMQLCKVPTLTNTAAIQDIIQQRRSSWLYLGNKNEAEVDVEIAYALNSAVAPKIAASLLTGFMDRGFEVSINGSPALNLIRLAILSDQIKPAPNRIMLDFGATGTRIVIISDGVPVFTTELTIGTYHYIEQIIEAFRDISVTDAMSLVRCIGLRKSLSPKEISKLFDTPGIDQREYYEIVDNLSRILLSNIQVITYTFFNDEQPVAITYTGRMVPGLKMYLSHDQVQCHPFNPLLLYDAGLPVRLSPQVRVDSTYFGALAMATDII